MTPALYIAVLYALAGLVGLIWGLSEIISAFKNETGRALRTGGAWLLLLLNFAAAAGVYALILAIVPDADHWLVALTVGMAWPTVIRNASLKLAQPLQSDQVQESAAIRLEQAYGSFQDLARQLINNDLTRQRLNLVTRAIQLDLQELAQHARLALIASPLQADAGMPDDDYVDRILQRSAEDVEKKALLAAFILENFGREMLESHLQADTPGRGMAFRRPQRFATTKPDPPPDDSSRTAQVGFSPNSCAPAGKGSGEMLTSLLPPYHSQQHPSIVAHSRLEFMWHWVPRDQSFVPMLILRIFHHVYALFPQCSAAARAAAGEQPPGRCRRY